MLSRSILYLVFTVLRYAKGWVSFLLPSLVHPLSDSLGLLEIHVYSYDEKPFRVPWAQGQALIRTCYDNLTFFLDLFSS